MLSVAIVEDQKRTREGLAALLAAESDFRVVGPFASMEEALPVLTARAPDALLCDIALPGMSGIEGVRRLKVAQPELRALMLTVHADDGHVFEAICAGASGYLLKDTPPDRLVAAVRELAEGGAPMSSEVARRVLALVRQVVPPPTAEHELTPRELDVLRALAAGHSYKTAARELALAIDTIRFHVRSIYAKLHVHSKSEAVLQALRRGLVR